MSTWDKIKGRLQDGFSSFTAWVTRSPRGVPVTLSQLTSGNNYVIRNGGTESNGVWQVITLLSENEENRIGVTRWQEGDGIDGKKKFKIEDCLDCVQVDWILTAYNSEPELQWVVNNTTLEVGNPDQNQIRQPRNEWRFGFEEVGEGSRKYLITSRREDLMGKNYLRLIMPQNGTAASLVFAAKNENDPSLQWCLFET